MSKLNYAKVRIEKLTARAKSQENETKYKQLKRKLKALKRKPT